MTVKTDELVALKGRNDVIQFSISKYMVWC